MNVTFKNAMRYFSCLAIIIVMIACKNKSENNTANNTPIENNIPTNVYTDSVYTKGVQTLPGKLHCEYFNLGGEGIGYHDTDSINSGSGRLNKGTDYLSAFRIDEAVDISFTKYHDSIDNSKFNIIKPKEGQLYLGWTEAGEWTTYTVDVKTPGTYLIGAMYTSNQNAQISIETEDGTSSGVLNITSTFHPDDPIGWRQWHHWNFDTNLGKIELKGGIQILKMNIVAIGQMNFDYLSFTLIK